MAFWVLDRLLCLSCLLFSICYISFSRRDTSQELLTYRLYLNQHMTEILGVDFAWPRFPLREGDMEFLRHERGSCVVHCNLMTISVGIPFLRELRFDPITTPRSLFGSQNLIERCCDQEVILFINKFTKKFGTLDVKEKEMS
jgi:hypothetical protein